MLLEVPGMANDSAKGRATPTREISRSFRISLDRYERQIFAGPPENAREHVIVAARSLLHGDWEHCIELVLKLRVWGLWHYCNADMVKELLRNSIKKVALSTYIMSYSSHYDSMQSAQVRVIFISFD